MKAPDTVAVRLWKNDDSVDIIIYVYEYVNFLEWCSRNNIQIFKVR